jgi:DNA (cytosine-5)-methyltransferase 1
MRSVELFAGCGGLALGLARAGFEHKLVVEIDPQAVATLLENKRRKMRYVEHWPICDSDTRDIDFEKYSGVDLVSGGPPCQPFSIGGKHLGPGDQRNMWPEAIRAVREIRPKAFMFENVRGLLRPAFSAYLEYITLQLTYPDLERRRGEPWRAHLSRLRRHGRSDKSGRKTEYRVVVGEMNAADYGAPQKRHRAIVMGVSSIFGDEWKFPARSHSQEALAWAKHVKRAYWERHGARRICEPSSPSEQWALDRALSEETRPKGKPWVTVRDALVGLPPPRKKPRISGHWQHPGARTYWHHTGSNLDEPAKALKAGDHGVPGGENMLTDKFGGVRYFTVREMARLQGLPDNFVILGTWKAATRQLGNAVPTSIGQRMGEEISTLIKPARRINWGRSTA